MRSEKKFFRFKNKVEKIGIKIIYMKIKNPVQSYTPGGR